MYLFAVLLILLSAYNVAQANWTSFLVYPKSESEIIPQLVHRIEDLGKLSQCSGMEVKMFAVPKSQLLSTFNYVLANFIVDSMKFRIWTYFLALTKRQSTSSLVFSDSYQYIRIFTVRCGNDDFLGFDRFERVFNMLSVAGISFVWRINELHEVRLTETIQYHMDNMTQLLKQAPYPKGDLFDMLILSWMLLFASLVPLIGYFAVRILLNIWRTVKDKKTAQQQLVDLMLPDSQSTSLTSLHNVSCPVCWSEFSNLLGYDTKQKLPQQQQPSQPQQNPHKHQGVSRGIVFALMCNHAMCRDCLIKLEKHRLAQQSDINALPVVSSVRCPYCCQKTNYTALKSVKPSDNVQLPAVV